MRLLFFKAPWCATCCAIDNEVPTYAERVDCAIDPDTAVKYSVCTLPLFVAVDSEGNEKARIQTTNMRMLDRWFQEVAA
jgi:hypothetical protein